MIKPISKKKYYETISEQIIQAILSGEWAEGSRVPTEDKLASIFKVGRGSIREAMTSLQIFGILVSSPGIGTYVADNAIACIYNTHLADVLSDPDNLDDMMQARRLLEPLLAAYAAENARAADIRHLENAVGKATAGEWAQNGHLFHLVLSEICGNEILISFFKSIEEPTRKKREENLTDQVIARWVEEYHAILDAIRKNDPQQAEQLMRDHLQ